MSKRSPSARRTKQALAALAMKRENPDMVLNYKRFVFSVLCTGSNPIQSMTMMLINNILPLSYERKPTKKPKEKPILLLKSRDRKE